MTTKMATPLSPAAARSARIAEAYGLRETAPYRGFSVAVRASTVGVWLTTSTIKSGAHRAAPQDGPSRARAEAQGRDGCTPPGQQARRG
jgi:hypothetical protein